MQLRSFTGALAALTAMWLGAAPPATAQQEQFRVRGTIESVKGESLVVEARNGEVMGFELTEDTGVFMVRPASLEDVEEGDFVGLTSVEADGKRVALEAHIFAEDLRGVGEGHYAWDLVQEPNMMTNATIAEIDKVGAQRELEVTYREGEGDEATTGSQTIYLPPDVPVVHLEKAPDRGVLEPGKSIFVMVEGPRDGIPQVLAAVVGTGETRPPM